MAAFRIKLYSLKNKHSSPNYIGPMKSLVDECFRDFKLWLEGARIVEWAFDFWNIKEHSCMKRRAKGVSPIDQFVYVICASMEETNWPTKRRPTQFPTDDATDLPYLPEGVSDGANVVGDNSTEMPLNGSSGVSDPKVEEVNHVKSILLSVEVLAKYADYVTKLSRSWPHWIWKIMHGT